MHVFLQLKELHKDDIRGVVGNHSVLVATSCPKRESPRVISEKLAVVHNAYVQLVYAVAAGSWCILVLWRGS